MHHHKRLSAFTLAELLIALAILGVIATFTIPKILLSQQNSQYNATAKEAISMMAAAFQNYRFTSQVYSGTTAGDFTSYLNYVYLDTSRTIDSKYGSGTLSCAVANAGCLILHNGGALRYNGSALAGTASTNALEFIFDPDGQVTDGTTNGPGKSVNFFIYATGQVTTRGTSLPNTFASGTTYASPVPSADPPWFSW